MRGGCGGLQAGVQSVVCGSMENPYRYKLIYINIYIYIYLGEGGGLSLSRDSVSLGEEIKVTVCFC